MSSEVLRREPFRILFPVGALLAWVAVLPWVLFGAGLIRAWLGVYHAMTMTEGFVVAMAVGFLGTMLPRRTSAPPLTTFELALVIGALLAVPASLVGGHLVVAQAAYLVVLGTLVRFALRGVRRAGRPPHASFIFLPLGIVAGVVGAIMIAVGATRAPSLLAPGRALVEEGLLLSLVLAITPMLTPIIMHGHAAPAIDDAAFARQRALHVAAAALLFGSFVVERALSLRGGLLLRGAVLAAEVLLASRIDRFPTVDGLHRWLYWLALVFVPLGSIAAAAQPAFRVPFLHLTFVGGFSLLVFAVSFHVVFLHTGREMLARGRPWPVALVAALAVLATAARVSAEHFPQHYFAALTIASSLWLAGALVWGIVLVRLITLSRSQ